MVVDDERDDGTDEEHQRRKDELESRRWKHRRRMAYTVLIYVLVLITGLVLSALFSPGFIDTVEKISDILATFVVVGLGITATYMGAATYNDTRTRISTSSKSRSKR